MKYGQTVVKFFPFVFRPTLKYVHVCSLYLKAFTHFIFRLIYITLKYMYISTLYTNYCTFWDYKYNFIGGQFHYNTTKLRTLLN